MYQVVMVSDGKEVDNIDVVGIMSVVDESISDIKDEATLNIEQTDVFVALAVALGVMLFFILLHKRFHYADVMIGLLAAVITLLIIGR